ncbi:MAG: hypothetical protein M3O22_03525 [Pseudomonadota bacterium]|nr:hypothetical protein [Pseudomonadota bacterium]
MAVFGCCDGIKAFPDEKTGETVWRLDITTLVKKGFKKDRLVLESTLETYGVSRKEDPENGKTYLTLSGPAGGLLHAMAERLGKPVVELVMQDHPHWPRAQTNIEVLHQASESLKRVVDTVQPSSITPVPVSPERETSSSVSASVDPAKVELTQDQAERIAGMEWAIKGQDTAIRLLKPDSDPAAMADDALFLARFGLFPEKVLRLENSAIVPDTTENREQNRADGFRETWRISGEAQTNLVAEAGFMKGYTGAAPERTVTPVISAAPAPAVVPAEEEPTKPSGISVTGRAGMEPAAGSVKTELTRTQAEAIAGMGWVVRASNLDPFVRFLPKQGSPERNDARDEKVLRELDITPEKMLLLSDGNLADDTPDNRKRGFTAEIWKVFGKRETDLITQALALREESLDSARKTPAAAASVSGEKAPPVSSAGKIPAGVPDRPLTRDQAKAIVGMKFHNLFSNDDAFIGKARYLSQAGHADAERFARERKLLEDAGINIKVMLQVNDAEKSAVEATPENRKLYGEGIGILSELWVTSDRKSTRRVFDAAKVLAGETSGPKKTPVSPATFRREEPTTPSVSTADINLTMDQARAIVGMGGWRVDGNTAIRELSEEDRTSSKMNKDYTDLCRAGIHVSRRKPIRGAVEDSRAPDSQWVAWGPDALKIRKAFEMCRPADLAAHKAVEPGEGTLAEGHRRSRPRQAAVHAPHHM